MSNISVITYCDPLSLDRNHDFIALCNDIFISGTDSLKYAFTESSIGSRLKTTYLQFSSVLESMVDPWHRTSTKLSQLASISRAINEATDPCVQNLINAKESTLEAIRSLVEQGYTSRSYQAKTDKEKAMCLLWESLEGDFAFQAIQNRVFSPHAQSQFLDHFAAALDKADIPISKRYAPNTVIPDDIQKKFLQRKRVVLTGFYFVTPVQYKIIELLHQAGIEIIFYNHWDPRYPEACSIWEEFFGNPDFPLLPPRSSWNIAEEQSLMSPERHFIAQRLSGQKTTPMTKQSAQISIMSYANTSSFLESMAEKVVETEQQNDGQYVLFVPKKEELEEIFRDFFPDKIKINDRHFLSYPIGSLLFHLHEMWEHNSSELKLTNSGIQECLASGWISFSFEGEIVNGDNILPLFRKVQNYFQDCTYLQEWKDRASFLESVINNVVESFQPNSSVVKTETYRFHEYMSNPLRLFSFFDITPKEASLIAHAIGEIAHLGTTLFSYQQQPVSLKQHFQNIQKILLNTKTRSNIHQQEQLLLDELQRRLEEVEPITDKFLFRDLKYGVNVYLSGGLAEEKEQQKEPFQILPFAKLDELLFLGNEMEAHICMMSDDLLPRKYNFPMWPATLDALPDSRITRQLTKQTQIAQKIDTYLIFIAGAWGRKVTMSWIEDWKDKERVQSPYISLLLSQQALEKKASNQFPIDGFGLQAISVTDWEPPTNQPQHESLINAPSMINADSIPKDVISQAYLCPRRFFYGFVVSHHPTVDIDFQYKFLYGSMTRILGCNNPTEESTLKDMMSDIMPNFSHFFKEGSFNSAKFFWNNQKKETFTPNFKSGGTVFEGHEYRKSREKTQILGGGENINTARNYMVEANIDLQKITEITQKFQHMEYFELPQAEPSEQCKFCPFSGICDRTQYPGESNE